MGAEKEKMDRKGGMRKKEENKRGIGK